MSHTPGPWINDQGLVNGTESRARFAPGVSVDLFDAAQYPDELREEMLANAALIAAAPDMLAALKGLRYDPGDGWGHYSEAAINAACAAIAKAEGR